MKILSGSEEAEALRFIDKAVEVAKMATCERAKCGSIIVKTNTIIGKGFNSPPGNLESQRKCSCSKDSYDKKVTDKTCCVHAEQRAIIDSLKRHNSGLKGSRMYFIRMENNKPVNAKEPYCTHCSKLALDVGISEFVLLKDEGVCVYDTEEYNLLSFNFGKY